MIISAAGGAPLPRLAPQLTFFSDKSGNTALYVVASGIDATGSLTTLLSLTGAFLIELLWIQDMVVDDLDHIRLTVDGVVIWNEDGLSANGTTETLIGRSTISEYEKIICDASFLLEVEMSSDTAMTVIYIVRPIL